MTSSGHIPALFLEIRLYIKQRWGKERSLMSTAMKATPVILNQNIVEAMDFGVTWLDTRKNRTNLSKSVA